MAFDQGCLCINFPLLVAKQEIYTHAFSGVINKDSHTILLATAVVGESLMQN